MLKERIVKCPKCRAVFTVTNPGKLERLRVTCLNPECTCSFDVVFEDGKTELPEDDDLANVGKFILQAQEISLERCINMKFSIGRASMEEEHPDIGFVTDDRSMSRVHCNVETRRLDTGKIKVIISDARMEDKIVKRPLEINGIRLFPADRIVLCDGDTIKMGNTIVLFSQK